ncbi:RNA-binding motif protein, X-linked 2 [Condylostylus longicornis]|uniref:RNA-binding motif protein, X-linked 2 n=1 Tax=Condylostylus longicornis TaxID=2530218 RepID=UPI00244DB2C7|nr:RNA-binding motif protein, X-linked 2 [Condylostylus longicornis]
MNPLTNMKNVLKLSENELKSNSKTSWHDMYKDSAWIFVGGLPYDLTEGDIICVFSQYGEIVNINLVRDKKTGKSKGFCFICFEDQRSTVLSVDNLNGIKILGRTLRVDHVAEYKVPKDDDKIDEETRQLRLEGCAPKLQIPSDLIKEEKSSIPESEGGIKLPERLPIGNISEMIKMKKEKKSKKSKKVKKEKKASKKRKHKKKSSESDSGDSSTSSEKNERRKKKRRRRSYSNSTDSD